MYFMPGEAAVSPSAIFSSTAGATAMGPISASSISLVTAPGRSSVGVGVARVITVDSTP